MYIGYGYGYGRAKKAGGFDPIALAYFAAVPNSFDATRKTIINDLIAGLRADGNLTKLDRLWLFANTTTGNAVIDVIGLNSATLVNAPAFVADQGYTGNGTTSYVNTNFKQSVNGVNYTANNSSIGIYSRTNLTEARQDYGANTIHGFLKFTDNNFYARMNNNSEPSTGNTVSSSAGFSSGWLTFSGSGNFKMYKNGIEVHSGIGVTTSAANSSDMWVCANNGGSFGNKQISTFFLGSASVDHATLYTRIQTYMTSLGTQV